MGKGPGNSRDHGGFLKIGSLEEFLVEVLNYLKACVVEGGGVVILNFSKY